MRELSETFGVTPGAISAALKRTGTTRKPAPPGPRAARKRRAAAEELPPEPEEAASRKKAAGTPAPRPGSKDAKLHVHHDKLGKVPDREVADLAGVSVRTVASYRARNAIPGYKGPRRGAKGRRGRRSKIDPFADQLGQVADRVIAERARGQPERRSKLPREEGDPCGGVAQRRVTTPTTAASGAWKVTVAHDGEAVVRVVLAATVVEAANAAQQAAAAAGGRVTGLEWVGPLA